ncbi:Telomeric repeat-binding factor 2 [Lysinibacillus sphaericus]|nr:Telomeric repeat-binding factor 2 [Lysinibacillus sphaericus]
MKKFFKFGCLGIIALIVLIIVIVALSGGSDDAGDTSGEKAPTSGETKTKDKPAKEEPAAGSVGKEMVVGKASFLVNEVTTADQVGPSVLPEKASEKFVVVNVTYKNNGNEAVSVDASFFKLKLGDKTYEADSVASMSANQGEDGAIDNSFFYQSVNPDSTITGFVVYDVAETVANSDELTLQVQTGVFGTETGLIKLK